MGTMNKMRENTGVVLWILVFAFGVIWVLQDSGGLDVVGTTTGRNIIVVDGDAIHYDEYAQAVDQRVQQYQQQTGETMPPQMVDQQREVVYQQLVDDRLREHEMDRLGINVTDREIYDMVMGPQPHQIIQMYFGDEDGNVNRALLQNFIENPEARQDWIQIEEYLRAERRREKMENLIAATVRVSEQDILEEYRRRNLSVDVEWVGLRYADIPNDSVTVTDRDLRRYYDENRSDFERPRTYTFKYVTLSKQPSAEDSTAILAELERLAPRFESTENDSLFLARNASETPFDGEWQTANQLDEAVATRIFPDPQPGTIVGPFVAGSQAHLVKILDVRPAESEAVQADHILIRSPEDSDEISAQLEEIRGQIDSGDLSFEEAARRHSQDGSASRGGDLGWFGRGQMVDTFEEAAFAANIGEVIGPIKTQFGYHLIRVNARAASEVRIADYSLQIRADIATLNNMQEQLEDLRYFTDETGDFEAEAERLGMNVQTVQITPDQEMIPGLGSSRTVLNFLQTASEGELSPVLELNDVYVVGEVEDIVPEGYRPFEEVRSEIEPRVIIEKKQAILTDRLERALQNAAFDGLPARLGTEMQTTDDVTFNSNVIPGLGREPKFIGTALGVSEGEVSNVVAGENGVFILRATSVSEPPPITEAQRAQIRQQLLQQRRTEVSTRWLSQLRESASISDNRHRFLQQ